VDSARRGEHAPPVYASSVGHQLAKHLLSFAVFYNAYLFGLPTAEKECRF
jgi:hypothetical protein